VRVDAAVPSYINAARLMMSSHVKTDVSDAAAGIPALIAAAEAARSPSCRSTAAPPQLRSGKASAS